MTYTKEQFAQIQKVEEVFSGFISNSPEVDLLYSKKIGYVLFCGLTATESTELIFQPQIMRDGRNLCYLLLHACSPSVGNTGRKYNPAAHSPSHWLYGPAAAPEATDSPGCPQCRQAGS